MSCPVTILTLPPEVLKHILNHLSYSYLESIRPTCKMFNEAATDLLCEGLHKIRRQVDQAAVKFAKATWMKTEHAGVAAVMTYAKRLAKGSGSLVILAGLIRAADVCSRQFFRVGALPPLPGSVLEEIVAALNMATWRNPLIGINRLQNIYTNLLTYFLEKRVLNPKQLPQDVMFQTVLDVLQNMPRLVTSDRLEQTDHGVRLSCTLPRTRINLQPLDSATSSDIDELLYKLVQLSMHVVDRYILTSQAQRVMGDDPVSDHEAYIRDIQLTVPCSGVQDRELSYQLFRNLKPTAFFVTLSGFRIANPPNLEDLQDSEEVSLNFSFCEFDSLV